VKIYGKAEIEKFLLAIDENLTKRFDLIIIGGTAAALAYHVTSFTKDIDTVNSIKTIEKPYNAAKTKTGLYIPMGPVGIDDGPNDYQDRLMEHAIPGMKHLKIFVPERHDFVLIKMLRGQQNDLDTVAEMHQHEPLSFEKLLERILSEMNSIVGNKRRIKPQFLAMFETLFGEAKVKEAETRLKGWD
jgi:hypothetical protein